MDLVAKFHHGGECGFKLRQLLLILSAKLSAQFAVFLDGFAVEDLLQTQTLGGLGSVPQQFHFQTFIARISQFFVDLFKISASQRFFVIKIDNALLFGIFDQLLFRFLQLHFKLLDALFQKFARVRRRIITSVEIISDEYFGHTIGDFLRFSGICVINVNLDNARTTHRGN